MALQRKKWTAREEVSDEIIRFREKRKWQVALRRYLLEKQLSAAYAPYFGLNIERFRKWIELQFTEGLDWENFGSAWQFEHIIPVACFEFDKQEELALCWSFINIRVEKLDPENKGNNNLLAAKRYFEGLFEKTGFSICKRMIEKIHSIGAQDRFVDQGLVNFINAEKPLIEEMTSFSVEEMNRVNRGTSADDILLERKILNRFG